MVRKYSIFICLAIITAAGLCQERKTQSEYAALLARVKNADVTVDFKQLRFTYMESPERHRAKDTRGTESDMLKAFGQKDYKKAIANADAVLEQQYVNMDAHFVEYLARRELHEEEKSKFHEAIFRGLIKSIFDSGDGKSTNTAYVVVSTEEEYMVLKVLGLRLGNQRLNQEGGHRYDVLQATDRESNATVTVYFNVDIPFKHYLD